MFADAGRFNDTKTKTEMYTKTKILAKTDTETESFRSIVKKYFIFSILFFQKHFHAQRHKVNVILSKC
jgi:hypothetical protein